jgi:hypothetical protein
MPITLSHPTMKRLYSAFLAKDSSRHARIFVKTVRQGSLQISAEIRCHVLRDEWLDFLQLSLQDYWEERRGLVYVVANPVYHDCFKVGKTTKSLTERIQQLNNESVIGAFVAVQQWTVHDCHFLEKESHRALVAHHVHKEFFKGTYSVLCATVEKTIQRDIGLFESEISGTTC